MEWHTINYALAIVSCRLPLATWIRYMQRSSELKSIDTHLPITRGAESILMDGVFIIVKTTLQLSYNSFVLSPYRICVGCRPSQDNLKDVFIGNFIRS